jgi:hypothetical protein
MLWSTVAKTRADRKRKTIIVPCGPTLPFTVRSSRRITDFPDKPGVPDNGSGMPGRLGSAGQRHRRDRDEQDDRARDHKPSPPRESHWPPPARHTPPACRPPPACRLFPCPSPASAFPASLFPADPLAGRPLPASPALTLPGRPRLSTRRRRRRSRRIPGLPFRNGPARRCRRSRNECRIDHTAVVGHQPQMTGTRPDGCARPGRRTRRPEIRLHTVRLHVSWATISNSPRLATPLCYRRAHVRLPDQTLIRWYASSIV